jgi:hypothetical protein
MDPAALPASTLQHLPDRVGEALVGVSDHKLDPRVAALLLPRSLRLDPPVKERCHPFDPSIRGLEDMTNASLQRRPLSLM